MSAFDVHLQLVLSSALIVGQSEPRLAVVRSFVTRQEQTRSLRGRKRTSLIQSWLAGTGSRERQIVAFLSGLLYRQNSVGTVTADQPKGQDHPCSERPQVPKPGGAFFLAQTNHHSKIIRGTP